MRKIINATHGNSDYKVESMKSNHKQQLTFGMRGDNKTLRRDLLTFTPVSSSVSVTDILGEL